jgi:hypothetical protein
VNFRVPSNATLGTLLSAIELDVGDLIVYGSIFVK